MVVARSLICILISIHMYTDVVAQPGDPEMVQDEILDMLVVDDPLILGYIETIVAGSSVTVNLDQFVALFGFNRVRNNEQWVPLDSLQERYKIRIEIEMNAMRLVVIPTQSYPSKLLFWARERHRNTRQAPIQTTTLQEAERPGIVALNGLYSDLTLNSNRAGNPDLRASGVIELLGGAARIDMSYRHNRQNQTYTLYNDQFHWQWVTTNANALIKSVTIDNRFAVDGLAGHIQGVRISNKPIAPRRYYSHSFITGYAPIGSIVTWRDPISYTLNSLEVDNLGQFQIPRTLSHGSNKLNYTITQLGEGAIDHELIDFVPNEMIPTGQLEYALTAGTSSHNSSNNVLNSSIQYGISDWLNIESSMNSLYTGSRFSWLLEPGIILRLAQNGDIRIGIDSKLNHRASMRLAVGPSLRIEGSHLKPYNLDQDRFRLPGTISTMHLAWTPINHTRIGAQINTRAYNDVTSIASRIFISRNKGKIISIISLLQNQNAFRSPFNVTTHSFSALAGYRLNRNFHLTADASLAKHKQLEWDMVRLGIQTTVKGIHLNVTQSYQASTSSWMMQFGARMHINQLSLNHNSYNYGSSMHHQTTVSSAFMRLDDQVWISNANGSISLSGVRLIPFVDRNSNGKKDVGEHSISGMRGSIKEARRQVRNQTDHSLLFLELQPHRFYSATLDAQLTDQHGLSIPVTQIDFWAPANGIQSIFIPVVESHDFEGEWYPDVNMSLQTGHLNLILTDPIHGRNWTGSIFSDGTWLVSNIPAGVYKISIDSNRKDEKHFIHPNYVTLDASKQSELIRFIITNKESQ